MSHTCEKCAAVFKQKNHLAAHLSRKTPCVKAMEEVTAVAAVSPANEVVPAVVTAVVIAVSPANEVVYPAEKPKRSQAKPIVEPVKKLKMIDLFAGTGAFSTAFEDTGVVECVFANDMVPWSKIIYDKNHSSTVLLQDPALGISQRIASQALLEKDLNTIPTEEIPPHDLLTGGFPCQPFSIAGRREGFDDVRSNVFWKILEIIDHHVPRALVLENVKNLISHDEGETFKTIKSELEKRGYYIRYKVLDTAEITGVPQHRERIYLVCLKDKAVFDRFSLDFPVVPKRLITELLQDPDTVEEKYYYNEKSTTSWPLLTEGVTEEGVIYQYRRTILRRNMGGVCPTLTANMGSGGMNVPIVLDARGIRKLTPRECFRFQGFPDSYQFPEKMADCNLYKLAGNAVSLPVVKLIADRLVPLLLETAQ